MESQALPQLASARERTTANPSHKYVSANHGANGVKAQADPAGRLYGDGHKYIFLHDLIKCVVLVGQDKMKAHQPAIQRRPEHRKVNARGISGIMLSQWKQW